MTPDQLREILHWLVCMKGRDIYSDEVLNDLFKWGIAYHRRSKSLVHAGRSVTAPVFTSEEIRKKILIRGLGGELKDGEWAGISARDLAVSLCELLGAVPEKKYGTEQQFRAALRALEAHITQLHH